MGFNPRLGPHQVQSVGIGSIATNSSVVHPVFVAKAAGQILGATFLNSDENTLTSGSTAGSSVYLYLYKTASATASRVATWNGSGTSVATQATQALTMSTSTSLTRFSAGDGFFVELVGGAANNASNADCIIVVDFIYGHAVADSTSP